MFSDDALNSKSVERLDVRDKHLVTEIVYGSLRWQGMLDYMLAAASSRPWQEILPDARILLRMSLYQLWRMDRIPNHALVNDAVELAKRELGKGIDRYVNAVLRRLARTRPWEEDRFMKKAPPWVQVSLPRWLWERWAERYGERSANDFALSLNLPPRNAARLSEAAEMSLPSEVIESDLVPGAYFGIAANAEDNKWALGLIQYQDEASQLIPHLLGPTQGWKIWDACAAPGGKYAILRQKCGENGHVVASDLRLERIRRLVKLLKNDSDMWADVFIADARNYPPLRKCFDAVLADVPCSGLGTLRRNPEIKWQFGPERFAALQKTQKRILDSAASAVRSGGYLLYSTCSTEPEENEQIIESFLCTHPGFSLELPLHPQGVKTWTGQDKMVRTFPSSRLWDGFFAALMMRQK